MVRGLKLIIVHSHFRPGGVRRVIELAAPQLVARMRPPIDDVVLVGGEGPEAAWLREFRAAIPRCRVGCSIEPALGYVSEQRARSGPALSRRVAAHLESVLGPAPGAGVIVWAHNQGLGRNLPAARALQEVCAAHGVSLIFHHHDWWFDQRWSRRPEMRRTGFQTLEAIARAILPAGDRVRHAGINRADAAVLQRHFGVRAGWVPNLVEPGRRPPAVAVGRARAWLAAQVGGDAPGWLMPCRLLRRKNVAEALLLARWLRPEAWLVTTGAISSEDERAYGAALAEAARRDRWRLRLSVLAGSETGKPHLGALFAASEAILLTSLQEGFGLPYVEAVAARRPLISRTLPNIAPDLAHFGFRFRHSYIDIHINSALFNQPAEWRRQDRRWRAWREQLPAACRALARAPDWFAAGNFGASVPFSRLTFAAQREVLAHPPAESFAACAPLNCFLLQWRQQAAAGALPVAAWPERSARWLSGAAYARAFMRLVRARPKPKLHPNVSIRAMNEFVRAKLPAENQYPLLWSSVP